MAYGAVYKAQQRRIEELEAELELARRPMRSLLEVYRERRSGQIKSHTQFAFEVEFILSPYLDLQKSDQQ